MGAVSRWRRGCRFRRRRLITTAQKAMAQKEMAQKEMAQKEMAQKEIKAKGCGAD